MSRRGWPLVIAVMLCLASAGPAWAHAERFESTPEEGERVNAAPTRLNIKFTEPPIGDANFEVLDGCERDVVDDIEVQGTEITATLADGQPGNWSVRTQVVSGIDGHATKDRWRFRVTGEPECETEPGPGDSATDGGQDEEDQGGSFLLIFAGGTLAVIVLALVLRRKGTDA